MGNMPLLHAYTSLLDLVRSALKADQRAYLVGGAIRDMLLGLPVHDLDFALVGETIHVARQVARRLKAHYYVLDDVRHTGRVVTQREDGSSLSLDFVQLVENDIGQDLLHRDYTINAIAIDLADLTGMIDPVHGQEDLERRVLRVCSPLSLSDDPVRALRGIRLAVQFGLKMSPGTVELVRQAFPILNKTSPERQRDELFKILSGPNPTLALQVTQRLDGLPYLLPELIPLKGETQSPPHTSDVWDHTLAIMQALGWLVGCLSALEEPDVYQDELTNSLIINLGRFHTHLNLHLEDRINPDRSHLALLLLAALYHDTGKPATRTLDETGRIHNYRHEQLGADLIGERGRALMLSHAEVVWLQTVVRQHMRLHSLAHAQGRPSRKSVYHFFKDAGVAGIDLCLLGLADTLATYGPTLPQELWKMELDAAATMFAAWWDKPEENVKPPSLLDGHALIKALDLKPGPIIGRLLEQLREAQAMGQVITREDALRFVRACLKTEDQESNHES
jgi:tRNA nucleotidyltransferase/poly(A) polymerase